MRNPKSPSIVHHKARNADVVFLRGPDGKRRQIYLGRHGSPEARKRYHEVLAAYLSGEEPGPRQRSHEPTSGYPTVTQLVAEFLVWADREYLDAATGKVSREVTNFDHAVDHRE